MNSPTDKRNICIFMAKLQSFWMAICKKYSNLVYIILILTLLGSLLTNICLVLELSFHLTFFMPSPELNHNKLLSNRFQNLMHMFMKNPVSSWIGHLFNYQQMLIYNILNNPSSRSSNKNNKAENKAPFKIFRQM